MHERKALSMKFAFALRHLGKNAASTRYEIIGLGAKLGKALLNLAARRFERCGEHLRIGFQESQEFIRRARLLYEF